MKCTLGVLSASCLALVGYVLYVLIFWVPLQVDVRNDDVLVDTQLLGEYCSAVSKIQVTDAKTGVIVWEAMSVEREGITPVWTFSLVAGENELPEGLANGFRTIVPEHEPFILRPGRSYRIDVWGVNWLHHNSRSFVARGGHDETHNWGLQRTAGAHVQGSFESASARIAPW
jgi:hypothetical protein